MRKRIQSTLANEILRIPGFKISLLSLKIKSTEDDRERRRI